MEQLAGWYQGRQRPFGPPDAGGQGVANTGRVELVQLQLGHAEADHVWPYLDGVPEEIRRASEVAL